MEKQYYFVNGALACRPPEKVTPQIKKSNGTTQVTTRQILVGMEALAAGGFKDKSGADVEVEAGVTVFVRGEALVHDWSKAIYELEGLEPFVLVPVEFVLAVG